MAESGERWLKACWRFLSGTVPFAISQFSILNSQFARALTLAALFVLAAQPARSSPVKIEVRAGDGMERIAAGIRAADPHRFDSVMALVGLEDAGPPILVIVAPESSLLAKRAPSWVSGYAIPEENFVVVFPQRASKYPIDGLEELLRHEIAHVLIERASRGEPVPRWFNEGIATVAGDSWSVSDRSMVTLNMARGGEQSLARVEEMFGESEPTVARAYAFSGAFVNDLLRREGKGAVAGILSRVGDGASFEAAFVRVTGSTVSTAERDFWGRRTFWNRWVPLLTSSIVLWGLITLLATWATASRLRRDRARLAAMETEDELRDAITTAIDVDARRREDDEVVN